MIDALAKVNCKALEVKCCWSTHGRGNVATGSVETATLFQGEWEEGKQYKYPFKLGTALWPPTYYGTYLNVSHFVEARAKIAWAIDPVGREEFTVIATESPVDLAPTNQTQNQSGWFAGIIGTVVAIVLLLSFGPLLLFLLPFAAIGGAVYWFVRIYLPNSLLGSVESTLEPSMVTLGQTIRGVCGFTPKRSSSINSVTWTIRCVEKVSSGSGSTRKTHTHEVLCKQHKLMSAGSLTSGQPQKFDFSYTFPTTAPPSMRFADNELTWTSELRIDIPKWPDYLKVVPLTVRVAQDPHLPPVVEPAMPTKPAVDEDPWFTEVLNQVIQSRDDPDRMQTVLDAIQSQTFAICVDVKEETEEPLESDVEVEGIWANALDQARNLPLVVFIPKTIPLESVLWTANYRCHATVIGFETDTGRVMLQLT